MNRARHTTPWDALKDLHPAGLSEEAKAVLKDYYNSLGANIPDPPPAERHVTERARDAITNYLKHNPGATSTHIRQALGYGKGTTNDALQALHHEGLVERHRAGHNAYGYTVRP